MYIVQAFLAADFNSRTLATTLQLAVSNIVCTATEDRYCGTLFQSSRDWIDHVHIAVHVLICGSETEHCDALLIKELMFLVLGGSLVFTLVQTRTEVDTVQNISGFTSSSSDTVIVKVLCSHVTFMRRNSSWINLFLSNKIYVPVV